MSRYLVRRLVTAIPTLLLISFVLYAILSLAPGDPLSQFAANPAVPPEVRDNIRRSLGLDDPWPIRYVKWLFALAHGEWGFSFGSRMPVWDLIKLRIPSTLAVVGIAYLVSLVIAIPIGILSAVKQYSMVRPHRDDIRLHRLLGADVLHRRAADHHSQRQTPVAAVHLRLDAARCNDLASFGQQIKQSIMPIAVLGLFQAATFVRYTRASMLENLPQDYVRTARAKGPGRSERHQPPRRAQQPDPGRDADRALARRRSFRAP